MPKVVVAGLHSDPVADITAFLRERGVAAVPFYLEPPIAEAGLGPLRRGRDVAEGTHSVAGDLSAGAKSEAKNRCAVAVCWGKSAAFIGNPDSEIEASVVVVVGSTKQDVISSCVDSDADYAVLWPKEKDLLATVVRAEMGGNESTAGPDSVVPRVAVTSVRSAGATLLAGNLASEMASRGGRVCILDCDLRFGELTDLLIDGTVHREPTGASASEGWVRSGSIPPIADAVYTAVSGDLVDLLAGEGKGPEVGEFDLVVIDVPGREIEGVFARGKPNSGPLFDHLLVVVPLDYFGLRRARMLFDMVDGRLVEGPAAAVFCSQRFSGPAPEEALRLLGERRHFAMPWVPEEAAGALDEGRLIAPSERSPIGRALRDMGSWLAGGYISDLGDRTWFSGLRTGGDGGGRRVWPSI